MDSKERIARRVAKEIRDGDVVNLGIGLPEMTAQYIPEGVEAFLQSENGMLGMGDMIYSQMYGAGEKLLDVPVNKDYINAGCKFITARPGASFFDSATSFMLIRGGHVDISVLGALQVDSKGNLANHIIPGKMAPGMGGAMDLVNGTKKVIIATTHTQKGIPKIKEEITLPATAIQCVDMIVTELGVFVIKEDGLWMTEIAPGMTTEEVQDQTEAVIHISDDLRIMSE